MDIVDKIAERRIVDALERGELDNLPGHGKPLQLDDDSMVPPELRAAYRILKNAGFVPPQIAIRKDITSLQGLIMQSEDEAEVRRAARRLSMLMLRLEGRNGTDLRNEQDYYQKIVENFNQRRPAGGKPAGGKKQNSESQAPLLTASIFALHIRFTTTITDVTDSRCPSDHRHAPEPEHRTDQLKK